MEYEIELKLIAPENTGQILEQNFLPHFSGQVKKQTVQLGNYYFDTPDRDLRRYDIGLRIRKNGTEYEQTLKTAGKSLGGLHQRPEFNVTIENIDAARELLPNLALFDPSAWPQGFDLEAVQQELRAMFTTDFERHIYLLEVKESVQIEMVWDQGLIQANGQSVPICEIELELKQGQPGDLFHLAKQLLSYMPLTLGGASKAARGYRLASNSKQLAPVLSAFDKGAKSGLSLTAFTTLLENALVHFQYFIHRLSHEFSQKSIEQVNNSFTRLIALFDSFAHLDKQTELTTVFKRLKNNEDIWRQHYLAVIDNPQDKHIQTNALTFLSQPMMTELQLDIVQGLLSLNRDE